VRERGLEGAERSEWEMESIIGKNLVVKERHLA